MGDYFAIATLGFAEAVRLLAGEPGEGHRRLPRHRGHPHQDQPAALVPLTLALVWVTRNYIGSRHGRCLRGGAPGRGGGPGHRRAGVPLQAALLLRDGPPGGPGGRVLAHYVGFIKPSMFGIQNSTDLIVMVIRRHPLGHRPAVSAVRSSPPAGVPAGGRGLAPVILRARFVVFIMVVRPQGLLGSWELTFRYPRASWERAPRLARNLYPRAVHGTSLASTTCARTSAAYGGRQLPLRRGRGPDDASSAPTAPARPPSST